LDVISDVIVPIIAGISAGTIAGTFFGPIIEQKWKLRGLYLIPYREWCVKAYGYVHEFEEVCRWIRDSDDKYEIRRNHYFVIYHLWLMHTQAEEIYRWLGKMEKDLKKKEKLPVWCGGLREEEKGAYDAFNDLMDAIDRLWHYLETKYDEIEGNRASGKQFMNVLDQMTKAEREEISNFIAHEIEKDKGKPDDPYGQMAFNKILNYFKRELP
jgi:hypothetical protein